MIKEGAVAPTYHIDERLRANALPCQPCAEPKSCSDFYPRDDTRCC